MRVELIGGQVIDMAPIGPRHQMVIDHLNRILVGRVNADTTVRVQGPIRLSKHNAPQPDFALVHRRWQAYPSDHPGPADVYLLIEVADSSLPEDRTIKADLYARFGIQEYWIVDLTTDDVIVHREPENGAYGSIYVQRNNESLQVAALPAVTLLVAEMFE
jgi:Uma2 family endonuclease